MFPCISLLEHRHARPTDFKQTRPGRFHRLGRRAFDLPDCCHALLGGVWAFFFFFVSFMIYCWCAWCVGWFTVGVLGVLDSFACCFSLNSFLGIVC